ncbi:MAG: extracellular solute-binding protein [Oscillospiraceae bacterium]|nr:extracellular solute-binding protein [Oscillospiraceae bacterium]
MKFISVFLIFALVFVSFALFASCSAEGGKSSGKPAPGSDDSESLQEETEEPEKQILDSLPKDLDFKGAKANMIIRGGGAYGSGESEFYAEAENGEILNDAVYKRNRKLEDRLNLDLNVIVGPDARVYDSALNMIRSSIRAGDYDYDIVTGMATSFTALALEGLFMNLHSVDYLDLSQPWWNQNIVKEATIGGNLNLLVGDASVSMLAYSMILFANKNIMAAYQLPDIYQVIFEGKWTLDYMYGYIKDVHKDVNGDGVMDKEDLYGFTSSKSGPHLGAFMEAAGIKITKIGDDGLPYLAMDAERMAALLDKAYDIIYSNPSSRISNEQDYDMYILTGMMKNDRALLVPGAIADAEFLRDMETDYGIIPYPKYDEKQEEYFSRVAPYYTVFCIPANSVTSDMAGAVMEAMASASHATIMPAYFDVMMKIKFARDEQTEKILDIIRGSAYMDFSTLYDSSINSPWNMFYDLLGKKSTDFASWYEKNEPKIQSGIDNLIQKMEDMH